MILTDKDKKYLKSIGYEERDFNQIEEAMNKSTFGVFVEGDIDKCKVVDYETARELLGNEKLLSGLSRSAFHCSTSRIIPHTFEKYSLSIDSGILFTNNKSRLLKKHNIDFDIDRVEKLKDTPCIRIYDIEWDITDDYYDTDYEDDLEKLQMLPDEIIIPFEKIIGMDMNDIAEYISNETGFCHYSFDIECNYEIDELYEIINKIDKELNSEYKDLESMKVKIEALISLLKENDSYYLNIEDKEEI